MPSAVSSSIAGSPSSVAGTLISKLGRSTIFASSSPRFTVAAVSYASSGSTSMLTRPSAPFDAWKVGRKRSQAARTSSVVRRVTISPIDLPSAASDLISAEYLSEPEIAAEKMLGLVVTPTTEELLMSSAKVPDSSRSRDKSSSQIATPALESCFKFSDIFVVPLLVS